MAREPKIHYIPKDGDRWIITTGNKDFLFVARWHDDWDEYESDDVDEKFCENCLEFQGNTHTPMKTLRIVNTATSVATQFGHFCINCSADRKATETFIEMTLSKIGNGEA